jgi:hypothetical protein
MDFNFTKNIKDQKMRYGSVNVNADAKSGEIRSFWISTGNDEKKMSNMTKMHQKPQLRNS